MEGWCVDVVGIFRSAVAGAAQIADHVSGLDIGTLREIGLVGVVFAQMGVVIVTFLIQAADPNPPAAIGVPANGFHIAGLYGDNGGSYLPHHVMAQVLALKAIASCCPEIIIIIVGKALGDGRKGFQAVFCDPDGARVLILIFRDIFRRGFAYRDFRFKYSYHSVQDGSVCFSVVVKVLRFFFQCVHCRFTL